jgi:hypothetical protein
MRWIMLIGILMLPLSLPAAAWYGYCWDQKNSGVYCTPVAFSFSAATQALQCQNWAQGQGAPEWGWRRNTSQETLKTEQGNNCNYVNNLSKWDCYYKIADQNGLHTHHDLGNYKVFAANQAAAVLQCVQVAAARYLEILQNLGAMETMRPAAIMTIP